MSPDVGVRGPLAASRWRLACAWLGLAALGGVVESLLVGAGTSLLGSHPSIPVPAWAPWSWLALVTPGVTVAVVLLVKLAPATVGTTARRQAVVVTCLALSVLAACTAGLVWVLVGNLRSAHLVESGQPVNVWLGPGVYQVNQDPANDGFNDGPGPLPYFSVTGSRGPVEVTAVYSVLSPADAGSLFIGAGRNGYDFTDAGQFRITRPGEYRLVNDDDSIYPSVLVTAPYSAVATRTMPWIAGRQAAFSTLLACLALALGRFRRGAFSRR